jgi:hypothetical protein
MLSSHGVGVILIPEDGSDKAKGARRCRYGDGGTAVQVGVAVVAIVGYLFPKDKSG